MTRLRVGSGMPWIVVFCWVLFAAANALAQQPGALFPQPFVVEHAVVQTDGDGSVFETEPVTDTYAGSRIVSERADGSRLIIDFARREITEVRTTEGRYTVIGFDRMADLLRELQALEWGGSPASEKSARGDEPPRLRVVEVDREAAAKSARSSEPLLERGGVRHLRVLHQGAEGGDEIAVLDVWFDPQLRLGSRGLDALDEFEAEVLSATVTNAVGPRALAAARREAAGGLPILTVRPLPPGTAGAGTIEDVARRVEAVDAVPAELLVIPDGFERTPHPLELMVAHARSEAELDRRMGGGAGR